MQRPIQTQAMWTPESQFVSQTTLGGAQYALAFIQGRKLVLLFETKRFDSMSSADEAEQKIQIEYSQV
jgi:hypothetical protein